LRFGQRVVLRYPQRCALWVGDLLDLDCEAQSYRGYHADAAISPGSGGRASATAQCLLDVGAEALRMINISKVKTGVRIRGEGYQQTIKGVHRGNGLFVVHDYGDHGIGLAIAREPSCTQRGGRSTDGMVRGDGYLCRASDC